MGDRDEIEMVQLLKTLVDRNASDLYLVTGQSPVLRIDGHMERLPVRRLQVSDCVQLMQSITPQSNRHELEEKLGTEFRFAFGDQARFRVAVFRHRDKIGLVLRRLSVDGKHPN